MNDRLVLLPLDGSPLAETALGPAVAMAKGLKLSVLVLGVLDWPPVDIPWEEGAYTDRYRAYLDAVVARIEQQSVKAASELKTGRAADQILALIGESEPRLLVMSTHGRSGIKRWWYGSVASRLVREAPIDTMVVGPNVHPRASEAYVVKRVLVPLDMSPLAEAALDVAQGLVNAFDADLLLADAVWAGSQNYVWDVPVEHIAAIEQEIAMAAEAYLARLGQNLNTPRPVTTRILRGPPAGELTTFVEQERVDLVVMTSHCRTGPARTFLGSVADRMIGCSAPVLLVRPGPAIPRDSEETVATAADRQ